MCIQRSVLNHYILRHTNTERGEVPHSLDAARNHSIRNLLGYLNGDRQHTDINIVLAHLLFKIIGMENRNTVQCRTHQIRVHMASIGHPLLGDTVYGSSRNPYHLEGQALHAMILGFVHPRTGEYMEFTAPLPEYFVKLLTKLRK